MPTILVIDGIRFFFYSNEGQPPEPPHIHVRSPAGEAKFWLEPEVYLAHNSGYGAHELHQIARVVAAHRELFTRAWYDTFTENRLL